MINIDREHPSYRQNKPMWKSYRDLYAGGEHIKQNASDYLVRRQKEPMDVYWERVNRVFYENYIGSIIDWYAATLFRRDPALVFEGEKDAGRGFFAKFVENCDLRGTTLNDFYRQCLIDILITGESHILVDFPKASRPLTNRAEEDACGVSRAYLSRYQAEDLINWSKDERGDYEWIVLRQSVVKQPSVDSLDLSEETYWYYFDRETYRTYRRVGKPGAEATIDLIAQGRHGLAKQQRVPLFTTKVSNGLWLMNKTALLQLEHFNKSNALSWAITMGLFAMPVVYSDRDWTQMVGESYYIQLGPQDKFGWTEPEGKVYQIATDNLVRLKEEIYRVCYLPQASGEQYGGQAQSASSKQRDFIITQEVLRLYGDNVRGYMRQIVEAIAAAREDEIALFISGFDDFDIGDFTLEVEEAKSLLGMGVESKTLRKQIFQKLAFKYLCDARQDTKDLIAQEIEEQFS